MICNILWVGLGGFAGSVLRYLVSVAIISLGLNTTFPVATLTVNIAGSLLIGMLLELLGGNALYYLLITGFCGGFTTFSTFSADTFSLLGTGRHLAALGNILLSVTVCLVAVWLGTLLGTRINMLK